MENPIFIMDYLQKEFSKLHQKYDVMVQNQERIVNVMTRMCNEIFNENINTSSQQGSLIPLIRANSKEFQKIFQQQGKICVVTNIASDESSTEVWSPEENDTHIFKKPKATAIADEESGSDSNKESSDNDAGTNDWSPEVTSGLHIIRKSKGIASVQVNDKVELNSASDQESSGNDTDTEEQPPKNSTTKQRFSPPSNVDKENVESKRRMVDDLKILSSPIRKKPRRSVLKTMENESNLVTSTPLQRPVSHGDGKSNEIQTRLSRSGLFPPSNVDNENVESNNLKTLSSSIRKKPRRSMLKTQSNLVTSTPLQPPGKSNFNEFKSPLRRSGRESRRPRNVYVVDQYILTKKEVAEMEKIKKRKMKTRISNTLPHKRSLYSPSTWLHSASYKSLEQTV